MVRVHLGPPLIKKIINITRGLSSAGRAPALHAGGQEFDPPRLHHFLCTMKTEYILIEKERFTKNREKKRQEIVYSQEFKEKTKRKKLHTIK